MKISSLTVFVGFTVKMRITGTKNIAKITKSMKMVSAAKLRGDQQRLAAGDPFAAWASKITGAEQPLENVDVTPFPQRNLIVAMSTDKGLCGGVNSILTRMTRQMLARLDAAGKQSQLVVLGEGGSAVVFRGRLGGAEVAVKVRAGSWQHVGLCGLGGGATAVSLDFLVLHAASARLPRCPSAPPLAHDQCLLCLPAAAPAGV
jgi:hypothetical protein